MTETLEEGRGREARAVAWVLLVDNGYRVPGDGHGGEDIREGDGGTRERVVRPLRLARCGSALDDAMGLGPMSQTAYTTTTMSEPPAATNVHVDDLIDLQDNPPPTEHSAQDHVQRSEHPARDDADVRASMEEVWYLKDISFRPDPAGPPKLFKIITQNFNG